MKRMIRMLYTDKTLRNGIQKTICHKRQIVFCIINNSKTILREIYQNDRIAPAITLIPNEG